MSSLDTLKTDNIITIGPNESLSHALGKLGSSHDAAFVFNDEKKLMGVINPYHCLIKSSNPGNAKVEHCLFHPPKITGNPPVSTIARLMRESKVHYLPAFDNNNKFVGIVSARKLLSKYQNAPLFNAKIKDVIKSKKQPLVTIYEDDLISHAFNTFKTRKISKLVVIDKNMKLRGVLSYYDIINFLMTPRVKEGRGDRIGTRSKFTSHAVRNFAKTYTLTIDGEHTMRDGLRLILDKQIGSVIVVDSQNHPYGIITTQDFLNLMVSRRPEVKIEFISKNLSTQSLQIVGGFLNTLGNGVRRVPGVVAARLLVKEEKGGGVFRAALSLIPKVGNPRVIVREGKNLFEVLRRIRIKDVIKKGLPSKASN